MDLTELIGNNALNQDQYLGMRFGESDQLEVLGWFGRQKANKIYILKCDKCCQDEELYGEGIFKSTISNLKIGHIPCACSKSYQSTKMEYFIKVARKSKELGYEFLGFFGKYKRKDTRVSLVCATHGPWHSTTIGSLLYKSTECRKCAYEKINYVGKVKKPDELMIASFLATGAYHANTKFTRSERKNKHGSLVYWDVYCPVCEESGQILSGDLQKGVRPCGCSPNRQKFAYIIELSKEGTPQALKFGIANNYKRRFYQNRINYKFQSKLLYVYEFPDIQSCKDAELECKRSLTCGVVTTEEFTGGNTETTNTEDLEKILEIYEKHKGEIVEIL